MELPVDNPEFPWKKNLEKNKISIILFMEFQQKFHENS